MQTELRAAPDIAHAQKGGLANIELALPSPAYVVCKIEIIIIFFPCVVLD